MNLKAIVATLEEKCPNLFDQVRAGSWLVAAGGPAANLRPATIGIGFIPVAGAGVAAGRARAGHGAQDGWALQYQMVRQTGGGMSTLATQWHSRSGQTWRVKKSLHFVWTQRGLQLQWGSGDWWGEALVGPSLALWSAVGLREQMI